MRKTAEQTATEILYKCALSEEHKRNLMVGGATALNPIFGGITASITKPEGDPTPQFLGTLGGGVLGAYAGALLGVSPYLRNMKSVKKLIERALLQRRFPISLWVGGYGGGSLGGYLAQRNMANTRTKLENKELASDY